MGADLTGQWVRLGMAIIIIALVSIGLYQFSARARASRAGNHEHALWAIGPENGPCARTSA